MKKKICFLPIRRVQKRNYEETVYFSGCNKNNLHYISAHKKTTSSKVNICIKRNKMHARISTL